MHCYLEMLSNDGFILHAISGLLEAAMSSSEKDLETEERIHGLDSIPVLAAAQDHRVPCHAFQ